MFEYIGFYCNIASSTLNNFHINLRMKKIITLSFFIFLASNLFSTIDYVAVNDFTKEMYVFEEDNYRGIFWKSIGDTEYIENKYLNSGYIYTQFPYKLDYALLFVCFLIIGFIVLKIIKKSKKKHYDKNSSHSSCL